MKKTTLPFGRHFFEKSGAGAILAYIIVTIFTCICVLGQTANRNTSSRQEGSRPEILVLGVYHMANPGRDVNNMQADDVLAPKRQKEITELIAVLKKFRPTKVVIESNYGTETRPKQFAEYLVGKRELTRNEIEQIGFRIAKEMGHKAIYPADADGDFPWQRVVDYTKATGQTARFEAVSGRGAEMVKEDDAYLKTHTVLEMLQFMNADERVARDVGTYYLISRFGEPGDYAGPDLLAEWYRRNIRIYNNVMKIASSPNDRVLVIFGAGHLGWLRQDFANDPTVRLRKLEEFVTR